MAFFAVFALAAGFSKTPMQVDILNGVMGLMSAASVPPAQGMLANIYEKPSKRKNRVFACFSAGNPLGFVFGSIFSGIATQLFNWRASFFLLAIIYVVIVVIALFTVPADNTPTEKISIEAVKRFDVVGTILTIAGIGLFSAALRLAIYPSRINALANAFSPQQSWFGRSPRVEDPVRPRLPHPGCPPHCCLCLLGVLVFLPPDPHVHLARS